MRAYQIYSVGPNGRAVLLDTVDTAALALARLRDTFDDHPRAWVMDEHDHDVSMIELKRRAEEERNRA